MYTKVTYSEAYRPYGRWCIGWIAVEAAVGAAVDGKTGQRLLDNPVKEHVHQDAECDSWKHNDNVKETEDLYTLRAFFKGNT